MRLYRRQVPGTRLTLRLAGIFAVLAIVPVALVYGFSLHFLQRGIDSWFNVQVDRRSRECPGTQPYPLDLRMREVLKQTLKDRRGHRRERRRANRPAPGRTARYRRGLRTDPVRPGGRIIATATADPAAILPDPPPEVVLLQVRQGRDYVGLEPIDGLHIAAVVRVVAPAREERLLQALVPGTDRLSLLAGPRVQDRLRYLQGTALPASAASRQF